MDLNQFQQFLLNVTNPEKIKECEQIFEQFIQSNLPQLLELLFASINTFKDRTQNNALTLLGRIPNYIGTDFLQAGNEEFHLTVQTSLINTIKSITDEKFIKVISHVIASFALIYQMHWPSLFETLFGLITTPNPESPLAPTIALDCLWQCIRNESISLLDENSQPNEGFQVLLTLLSQVFESTDLNQFQMISSAQLAFTAFVLFPNENTAVFVEPVVKQIANIEVNNIDRYMLMLSNFSEENISFFAPIIADILQILIYMVQTPPSRWSQINSLFLLNNILNAPQFIPILKEQSLALYDLFIEIMTNEAEGIDFDEEIGIEPSNLTSVTQNAIELLSRNFSEPTEFVPHVTSKFEKCLTESPTPQSIYANIMGYAYAFEGKPDFYQYDLSCETIIAVFQAVLSNEDDKLRCAAIDCLNITIEYSVYDFEDQDSSQLINILLEAYSHETIPYIQTQIIKALSLYLEQFDDFEEFIEPIMGTLSQNFGESMIEDQQIYALDCFYTISNFLGQEFSPYMEPIYQFMKSVLSNYNSSDEFPKKLFYKCVEVAPQFQCLPDEFFQEISTILLTILSQIDISEDGDSNSQDSINKSLCSILKRQPEVFFPFAESILTSLAAMANTPLKYEQHSSDDDKVSEICSQETSVIKKFFPKIHAIRFYSNSEIDSLYECLTTFKVLIDSADAITQAQGFLEIVIKIVHFNLSQDFIPKKIAFVLFSLIIAIFRSSIRNNFLANLMSENGDDIPLAFQIYNLQKQLAFDALNELKTVNNDDDIESVSDIMRLITLSFIYITFPFYRQTHSGTPTEPSPILSQAYSQAITETIEMVICGFQTVNELIAIQVDQRANEFRDDLLSLDQLDTSIANLFIPIFAYGSPFLTQELIGHMNDVFKLEPISLSEKVEGAGSQLFISRIVFSYWKNFLMFFPAATNQMIADIIQPLIQVIQTEACLTSTISNALSTLISFLTGVNTQMQFNQNTLGIPTLIPNILEFLDIFLGQTHQGLSNSSLFTNSLVSPLIIVAGKMATNQVDPTPALALLVKMMPILLINSDTLLDSRGNCFALNDTEETLDDIIPIIPKCVQVFLQLIQIELPAMQTLEIKTTFIVLAALLFKQVKDNLQTTIRSENQKIAMITQYKLLATYIATNISGTEGNQITESIQGIYEQAQSNHYFGRSIFRYISDALKLVQAANSPQ